MVEHPQEFRHVGLLVIEPPGRNQTGRVALYLVIRLTSLFNHNHLNPEYKVNLVFNRHWRII